jgi:hypothetical protein
MGTGAGMGRQVTEARCQEAMSLRGLPSGGAEPSRRVTEREGCARMSLVDTANCLTGRRRQNDG